MWNHFQQISRGPVGNSSTNGAVTAGRNLVSRSHNIFLDTATFGPRSRPRWVVWTTFVNHECSTLCHSHRTVTLGPIPWPLTPEESHLDDRKMVFVFTPIKLPMNANYQITILWICMRKGVSQWVDKVWSPLFYVPWESGFGAILALKIIHTM